MGCCAPSLPSPPQILGWWYLGVLGFWGGCLGCCSSRRRWRWAGGGGGGRGKAAEFNTGKGGHALALSPIYLPSRPPAPTRYMVRHVLSDDGMFSLPFSLPLSFSSRGYRRQMSVCWCKCVRSLSFFFLRENLDKHNL